MKRVGIITGASQGLGLALARELASRDYSLVIDARRAERLAVAEDELSSLTTVVAINGDVTDPEHRQQLVDAAAALGPIDVIVNNASTLGASPLPTLDEIDAAVLRSAFETNVVAPVALYQLASAHLTPGATVVNITSDAAVEGYPSWGGYGATKAALEHVGRVLGAERPDLRVLTVDPGDMRTEMHQRAFPGEDISDRPYPETVVSVLVQLLRSRPGSGRYRLSDLRAEARPVEPAGAGR